VCGKSGGNSLNKKYLRTTIFITKGLQMALKVHTGSFTEDTSLIIRQKKCLILKRVGYFSRFVMGVYNHSTSDYTSDFITLLLQGR
jgi:hypothetical protein